ncbi:hypothetical protein Agub_g6849, partial [Astrephomene gubernaculifera]
MAALSETTSVLYRSFEILARVERKILSCPGTEALAFVSEIDILDAIAALRVVASGYVGLPVRSAWTALSGEYVGILLSLYSLALRGSCPSLAPAVPEETRKTYMELRAMLASHLEAAVKDGGRIMPCRAYMDVVKGLLRTQALRCYAALLADESKSVMLGHQVQGALDLLHESLGLVRALLIDWCLDQHPYPPGPRWFCDINAHLGDELEASGLLEHWACTFLHTFPLCGYTDTVTSLLHQLSDVLQLLLARQAKWGYLHFSFMDFSPSLSYLLSSHLVSFCNLLDGGTTYGLPAGAVVAPLFTDRGMPLRWADPGEVLSVQLATAGVSLWSHYVGEVQEWVSAISFRSIRRLSSHLPAGARRQPGLLPSALPSLRQHLRHHISRLKQALAAVEAATGVGLAGMHDALVPDHENPRLERIQQDITDCEIAIQQFMDLLPNSGVPPLNTQAGFSVAMRVAEVTLQRIRPAASGGAASTSTAPAAGPLPLLTFEQAQLVIGNALRCARKMCVNAAFVKWQHRFIQPWHWDSMTRLWKAALKWVETLAYKGCDMTETGDLLKLRVPEEGGLSPVVWSADVGAALLNGYVPQVEFLVRRLSVDFFHTWLGCQAPEAVLQLLCFSDELEMAALITTVAKVLRRGASVLASQGAACPTQDPTSSAASAAAPHQLPHMPPNDSAYGLGLMACRLLRSASGVFGGDSSTGPWLVRQVLAVTSARGPRESQLHCGVGQDAGSGSASRGQDAGSGSTSRGQDAGSGSASGGQDAGSGSASRGQDAGSGSASGGQDAGSGSASRGQGAGSGSASGGQDAGSGSASGGQDAGSGSASRGQGAGSGSAS